MPLAKIGGKCDYLTTDHAVMWNLGLCLQGNRPMAFLKIRLAEIADEVVQSLALFKAFPDVKIGMIESLGYFSVKERWACLPTRSRFHIPN